MDDKELRKRMMLAFVCLEGIEIGNGDDGYFDAQISILRDELEEAIIDRFSTRQVFDQDLDCLRSHYWWNFRQFKRNTLSE